MQMNLTQPSRTHVDKYKIFDDVYDLIFADGDDRRRIKLFGELDKVTKDFINMNHGNEIIKNS